MVLYKCPANANFPPAKNNFRVFRRQIPEEGSPQMKAKGTENRVPAAPVTSDVTIPQGRSSISCALPWVFFHKHLFTFYRDRQSSFLLLVIKAGKNKTTMVLTSCWEMGLKTYGKGGNLAQALECPHPLWLRVGLKSSFLSDSSLLLMPLVWSGWWRSRT